MIDELNVQHFERNDCTVVAIQQAFGISYVDAHELCSAYGRRDREGFHFTAKLAEHLKDRLKIHPEFFGLKFGKARLSKEKTYICIVDGHMFCVQSGKSMDNIDNSKKSLIRVFEVKS